jgi:serine protease Do
MFKYVLSVVFVFGIFVVSSFAASHPRDEKFIFKTDSKPALGVVVINVDGDELKALNLNGGARVKKVIEESEAERIGLKEGDIIVRFDGSDISDPKDLQEMISGIEEEKKVEIVVMRDGKEKKFEADLKPGEKGPFWVSGGDGKFEFNLDELPHDFTSFGSKGGFLGVETTRLSDQLKKYFEVDHGVLIESVIEDSPAAKAGLKAGDVITEISGKKIEDYGDLIRTVNYYDPGETVEVKYSRKGKINSVKVELGERKGMKWHHFGSDTDGLKGKIFLDEEGIQRNLDRNMRHLEDNLRGLERNLKVIKEDVAII